VVDASLKTGRLVSVLEPFAPPPTPLHLLHVGSARLTSRTRAFIDFAYPRLVEALASVTTGPPGRSRSARGGLHA
jgi:DNA-binding transcriptional LysR family regulator